MTIPYPSVVKSAIDRGQLQQVTRRVEIYESDAVTLWSGADASSRLLGGGVNITYGDNERRTFDLSLRNNDNALRSAPTGLWYDKVIKLYRGVKYSPYIVVPKVAIIDSVGGVTAAGKLINYLSRVGLPGAIYFNAPPTAVQLADYDIIVSYTGTAITTQAALLAELFKRGKNIITISVNNTSSEVPHLTAGTTVVSNYGVEQVTSPGSLGAGWTTEAGPSVTGTAVTALTSAGVAISRWYTGAANYAITGSIGTNSTNAKWFDLRLSDLSGVNAARLVSNVVTYFKTDYGNWETQIGEFVIDGISNAYYPSDVKITGRDYVKKCLNSKVEYAVSFDPATTVETLIRALGANAGITKFRLVSMPETIGTSLVFDRGTPRWDIMGAAARTQGYEIYFDQQGYLTTHKYLDPTLSPEGFLFQTGKLGNLASIDRSVNDSRIYNHIAVYGDPGSGETRLPYFGEVKNTNTASPTRISKIGDRYYSFASTFFTGDTQCQDYAARLLGFHSLESFELSFSAINYPWMEVGEIAKVIDPKAVATDPTKYLIDGATIPLDLGPMSFTGKRVVIV